MWKWLHSTVLGGINIFIKYIIDYIQVEEALYLCNKKCQKAQKVRNFEDLDLLNCQANYLYGRQAGSARAVI